MTSLQEPGGERAERYRSVIAPDLVKQLQEGASASAVILKARSELAEFNFGLSDEEYENIVGDGPDAIERYEKVCKVMGWLIDDGTLILYTPAEVIRAHSSGWPGLTPPEETRPLMELLASDDEKDHRLLKRTLEEMLGRQHDPFKD